jgi:hypothetical protein
MTRTPACVNSRIDRLTVLWAYSNLRCHGLDARSSTLFHPIERLDGHIHQSCSRTKASPQPFWKFCKPTGYFRRRRYRSSIVASFDCRATERFVRNHSRSPPRLWSWSAMTLTRVNENTSPSAAFAPQCCAPERTLGRPNLKPANADAAVRVSKTSVTAVRIRIASRLGPVLACQSVGWSAASAARGLRPIRKWLTAVRAPGGENSWSVRRARELLTNSPLDSLSDISVFVPRPPCRRPPA